MTSRSVWAGRYAIFDEIASGGMASVHLACRLGAGGDAPRVVALKKLFDTYAKQPEFVTMFLDEAHIAARIRHPNVVRTYEFLRVPDSLALVMELLVGVSLKDLSRIARDRAASPSVPVCAAIVRDSLEGLHAAHEVTDEAGTAVGLVHRDVSPHNIIVGRDGVSRVIDFGIAKAAGRLQVTEVGIMKGKFAYMAPEQIRAGPIDRRVDIYSSGIVLWEVLTGRSLFRGSADAEHFSKRGAGIVTASPPSEINEAVPRSLDEVVLRALAVDPADRFATAAEMAQAISSATEVAPAAAVAAWADGLAGSRLNALDAMRRAVEASHASGELAGLVASTPAVPTPAPPVVAPVAPAVVAPGPAAPPPPAPPAPPKPAYPAPSPDIPDLLPIDRAAKPRLARDRTSSAAPAAALDDAIIRGNGVADLDLDLVAGSHVRSPAAAAMIDARGQSEAVYGGARERTYPRERKGKGLVALVVLVALVGGCASFFGPPFVRSSLVAAAARRGLVLSLEGIEPRMMGLTLTGVTANLVNDDVVSAKAPAVALELDWTGGVRSISVPGYDLTVHGHAEEVAAHLAAWRARPHLPIALEAKAGHLRWSGAFSTRTTFDGLDVTTSVGGARDDSIHMDAASLTASLPHGSVGPWRAVLDSSEAMTVLALNLDRTTPDRPPTLRFEMQTGNGSTLSANIPRSKALTLGIPADLIHAGTDPEFEFALESHLRPTGEVVTAHARLGLFAVPTSTGAGSSAVDLVFEGSLAGEGSSRSIDEGSFSVGKVRSRMTGLVSFEQGGVRVQVDRPGRPGQPFVLDTREWMAAIAEDPAPKPSTEAAATHRR